LTGAWVPVAAGSRDAWTHLDGDIAEGFIGKRLSLGSHGYPQAFTNGRVELVHRIVMGCQPRDGKIVDHVNGKRWDNRRENLRLVTAAENTQNRHQRRAFRGAYRLRSGRWASQVKHQGRTHRLGVFATAEEAAAMAASYRAEHFTDCAT
jgi:hypothetical protein